MRLETIAVHAGGMSIPPPGRLRCRSCRRLRFNPMLKADIRAGTRSRLNARRRVASAYPARHIQARKRQAKRPCVACRHLTGPDRPRIDSVNGGSGYRARTPRLGDTERPRAERPTTERSRAERSKVERPRTQRPTTEKPSTERPSTERSDTALGRETARSRTGCC
jgi:hypothetical protein